MHAAAKDTRADDLRPPEGLPAVRDRRAKADAAVDPDELFRE